MKESNSKEKCTLSAKFAEGRMFRVGAYNKCHHSVMYLAKQYY